MTKKLKEGGELLEIKVLDHLISTKDGFYSFADVGDQISRLLKIRQIFIYSLASSQLKYLSFIQR